MHQGIAWHLFDAAPVFILTQPDDVPVTWSLLRRAPSYLIVNHRTATARVVEKFWLSSEQALWERV
jgi:hypothetical protein